MNSLILCNLPILSSTVEFELRQFFPTHPYIQNWAFWELALGGTSNFSPIHKEIEIFECCSSWTCSSFSQFMKKMEHQDFRIWASVVHPSFSQFTKEFGNWEDGLADAVCLLERGEPNIWLNCRFSRNRIVRKFS